MESTNKYQQNPKPKHKLKFKPNKKPRTSAFIRQQKESKILTKIELLGEDEITELVKTDIDKATRTLC